ncbi:hypothetical protein [Kitasatospora sp. NPDC017646]|uniref:hypothetical protein n=1 Tax=Kitasatospora sp. NPDC017646 TaxID=3364024 RepID=UPI0037BCDC3C
MYRVDRGAPAVRAIRRVPFRYPTAPSVQDTDTPELAARSDRLASDLGRQIRPGIRTNATVSSAWLVWERQHPAPVPRYTFERVHQLHLGQS